MTPNVMEVMQSNGEFSNIPENACTFVILEASKCIARAQYTTVKTILKTHVLYNAQ